MLSPFDTKRLSLRPLEAADAPRIEELISDLDVARMLVSVPHPYPSGAAKEFIAKILPEEEVFAVCLPDGRLIGCIAFHPAKTDMQLGYWLGKAFWGKGYMNEAAAAFLRRIFTEFTLDNVKTSVFADNPSSWRLQEKLGFKRTGEAQFHSLARAGKVAGWKTELAREDFLKLHT